jgi:hypothetical protein
VKLSIRLALLVSACLAGCASAPAVAPAPTVTASGTVQTKAADGRLLAAMSPWVKADIDHVILTLALTSSPNTPITTLKVVQADLSKQVDFTNLKQSTNYQVLARAYNTADESSPIDNAGVDASTCTTTFSTTTDPTASIGTIAVRLADKTYSGTTNKTNIGVTDGVVNNPTATEAITLY